MEASPDRVDSSSMRLRHWIIALALAVCTVSSATAVGAEPRSPSEAVRAYVAAINAKNGAGICRLLHPVEAKALSRYVGLMFAQKDKPPPVIPCPKLAGLIGSGGFRENSSDWLRMQIVQLSAPKPRAGGVIAVDAKLRHTYENQSSPAEPTETRFYVARVDGRYVIVRHSTALDEALWSSSSWEADLPPATREPRARDVKIPRAGFSCGTPRWSDADKSGDARAKNAGWLDIRSVTFADRPELCVTLKLAAPLVPGTIVSFSFQGLTGSELVVLPDGETFFTAFEAKPGRDFGIAPDGTLRVRFRVHRELLTQDGPIKRGDLRVTVTPMSLSEPLIESQPPMLAGDVFPDRT
jgi:hypothetical protein